MKTREKSAFGSLPHARTRLTRRMNGWTGGQTHRQSDSKKKRGVDIQTDSLVLY